MISAQSIQSKFSQLFAGIPINTQEYSAESYLTAWRHNRARKQALQKLAKRYPHYVDSLFDDYFLRHAGAQTLNRFLAGRLDRHAAARQLAADWYGQMEGSLPVSVKHALTEVTMAADDLLRYMEVALQTK